MFRHDKVLVSCLTLALFMAGFSAAHAAIVIDTFDGPDQQAPPDNEIDAPSAIGGKRLLSSGIELLGIVSNGLWQSTDQNSPGGVVSVTYRGEGTLGGIDLTEGGLNTAFEIVIEARTAFQGETLTLTVDDSGSGNSSFSVDWVDLPFSGSYLIPFSSLAGGADLTSVDIITVSNAIPALSGDNVFMAIDEISVGAGSLPQEDVVVDLGSIALWAWMNDAGWLKLNNSSPDRITTADMDGNGEDDVIADFASTLGGIFVKYNLGGWVKLANVASEQMTSGDLDNNGQDDVVIDAGVNGLWARMNDASWLKLNNASPEQVVVGDMDNNGADDVIGDFGVDGIFVKRNLGAWVKLHNNDPEDMAIGNLDNAAGDDLVVDFAGSLGLQARMNDSSWLKLHNGSPDVMATGDIDGNGADDVLAGFGSTIGGFWQKLNLGGWSQLNANSPDDMVTADVTGNGQDDIVGDFGDTIGGLFIKRDQGAWVKQHNTSPDSMAPGELD